MKMDSIWPRALGMALNTADVYERAFAEIRKELFRGGTADPWDAHSACGEIQIILERVEKELEAVYSRGRGDG